jgi:mRNA-degrading endonuclease toxin of MazEF toxin-antitoxin module
MPLFFARGCVYRVRFTPPGQPTGALEKYFVCLQEGRLFHRADDFVGVRITSLRENEARKPYPTDVYLTPQESHTQFGANVVCAWIHTIPKKDVIEYAYQLTNATMQEIDERLLIALVMVSYEEVEAAQHNNADT